MRSHRLPVLPPPGYSSGTRWCLDVVGNIFPPQISACSGVTVPSAWLGGRRLQVCRANLRRRAPYTQERDSDQGSRRGLALCKHTINRASICSCTAEAHHLPTPRPRLRVGRFCGTPTPVSPPLLEGNVSLLPLRLTTVPFQPHLPRDYVVGARLSTRWPVQR